MCQKDCSSCKPKAVPAVRELRKKKIQLKKENLSLKKLRSHLQHNFNLLKAFFEKNAPEYSFPPFHPATPSLSPSLSPPPA